MSFKKFIYEKDYIFKYVDPSVITFDAKKNQYWFISGSYKISLFYTEVELFPNVFFDRIQFKKRKIDENDTIIQIDFGNKLKTCLGEYVKNSPNKFQSIYSRIIRLVPKIIPEISQFFLVNKRSDAYRGWYFTKNNDFRDQMTKTFALNGTYISSPEEDYKHVRTEINKRKEKARK